MELFFVFLLTVFFIYSIVKLLPYAGSVVLTPFLLLKDTACFLLGEKRLSELPFLPRFLKLLKTLLLIPVTILFAPIISARITLREGKRRKGIIMVACCILIYGTIGLLCYFEYFL